MVTAHRRVLTPPLALIQEPVVFPVLAPYSIQTDERPSLCLDTIQPAERGFQSPKIFTLCQEIGKKAPYERRLHLKLR